MLIIKSNNLLVKKKIKPAIYSFKLVDNEAFYKRHTFHDL